MTDGTEWSEQRERAVDEMLAAQDRRAAERAKAARATKPRVSAPAGWYPDPSMVNTQRYWDGAKWTEVRAPAAPQVVPVAYQQPAEPTGLIVAGFITAVLIPFVGFIIAIVLMAKPRGSGAGVAVMILSGVSFFFWYAALTPDPSPTYIYQP